MTEAGFDVEEARGPKGQNELRLFGRLTLNDAGALRLELARRAASLPRVRLDLSGVEALDGAAAAILADARTRAGSAGRELSIVGAAGAVEQVLRLYTDEGAPRTELVPAPGGVAIPEQVGRAALALLASLRGALDFLGSVTLAVRAVVRHPRRMPWRETVRLIERHGADGLPIVGMIGLLIGLITAFQAAVQLSKLGADVYVADLVAISIARELGPLMTAIVVAGRSGAAIAAELGTMRVSEEIDALSSLGLDPYRFLVLPRLLAVTFVLPLLTLFVDAIGIAGGLLVATTQLDVSLQGYMHSTWVALDVADVFGGLLKALVFGVVVALIASERGLATRGGAEGVGRATTAAVVAILFHLILADAVLVVLFNRFGI